MTWIKRLWHRWTVALAEAQAWEAENDDDYPDYLRWQR